MTLKNSFTQLTWRGLEMKRESEVSVHLREMQGVMGIIELDYVTSTTDEDGSREFYDVTESFTMKWNTQRIYMMNYDRRVNQIFSGESNLYSDQADYARNIRLGGTADYERSVGEIPCVRG